MADNIDRSVGIITEFERDRERDRELFSTFLPPPLPLTPRKENVSPELKDAYHYESLTNNKVCKDNYLLLRQAVGVIASNYGNTTIPILIEDAIADMKFAYLMASQLGVDIDNKRLLRDIVYCLFKGKPLKQRKKRIIDKVSGWAEDFEATVSLRSKRYDSLDTQFAKQLKLSQSKVEECNVRTALSAVKDYMTDAQRHYTKYLAHTLKAKVHYYTLKDSQDEVLLIKDGLTRLIKENFWNFTVMDDGRLKFNTKYNVVARHLDKLKKIDHTFNFGRFEFIYDPLKATLLFKQGESNRMFRGYPHPHIGETGSVCWGEHKLPATTALMQGDVYTLLHLLQSILMDYCDDNPHKELYKWLVQHEGLSFEDRDEDDDGEDGEPVSDLLDTIPRATAMTDMPDAVPEAVYSLSATTPDERTHND